jgi:hypothetical protein
VRLMAPRSRVGSGRARESNLPTVAPPGRRRFGGGEHIFFTTHTHTDQQHHGSSYCSGAVAFPRSRRRSADATHMAKPDLRRALPRACLAVSTILGALYLGARYVAEALDASSAPQHSTRCLCSRAADVGTRHGASCDNDDEQRHEHALLSIFDRYRLRFHAQSGQDRHVLRRLILRCGTGFFVEFGAGDGIKHSNTLFFARQLGWKGLLFEAEPNVSRRLHANRPDATVYQGAVCPTGQRSVAFGVSKRSGWSGAVRTYEPIRRARLPFATVLQVRCYDLAAELRQHRRHVVDYMTIDTEGSELDILESFPWEEFSVRIVQVEQLNERRFKAQRGRKARAIRHMKAHGYDLVDGRPYAVGALLQETDDLIFELRHDMRSPPLGS